MPTILRVRGYRFLFFSNEGNEPPHIHVKARGNEAKFWLDSIRLAANYGFKAHELQEIQDIVREHKAILTEAWREYLG